PGWNARSAPHLPQGRVDAVVLDPSTGPLSLSNSPTIAPALYSRAPLIKNPRPMIDPGVPWAATYLSYGETMSIDPQPIASASAPAAIGPYSQAVLAGGL